MTVEPVNVPAAGSKPLSGTQIAATINKDDYWKNKAVETRAMREVIEEQENIKAIRQGPQPNDPPIKIGGSINLGNFDLQEQTRQLQAQAAAAAERAEANATALRAENEKLKETLLTTTINNLQSNLGQQIQKLQADLAGNRGSPKSIGDQIKEVLDTAAQLGMVRPEAVRAAPALTSSTDAALSLEMLRLQLQDKATERTFAWTMEKDRREFQIQLKKLDQANRLAAQDLAVRQQQGKWIQSMPGLIGSVITDGLLAAKGGGATSVAGRAKPGQRRPPPAEQGDDMQSETPDSISPDKVSALPGESGSITCPECSDKITIGPTATRAVCASCDYQVAVVREERASGT